MGRGLVRPHCQDIAVLRGVCEAARAKIPLIAKIEKHEAIDNIDAIMAAVDGMMVARGDLGVEMPDRRSSGRPEDAHRRGNAAGKPVITATQMLDSMIRNPRPTRAEVTDVANAIFDGTDAVMLSGETAVGAYPYDAVRMMAEVATHTEAALDYAKIFQEKTREDEQKQVGKGYRLRIHRTGYLRDRARPEMRRDSDRDGVGRTARDVSQQYVIVEAAGT